MSPPVIPGVRTANTADPRMTMLARTSRFMPSHLRNPNVQDTARQGEKMAGVNTKWFNSAHTLEMLRATTEHKL